MDILKININILI